MIATLVLIAYTFINIIQYFGGKGNHSFWKSHQWAGAQNRLFPKTRAGIDAIRHTCEVVGEGYERV